MDSTDARPKPSPAYHLDISIEGEQLHLTVDGPDGPQRRAHVAEVARAADECGLRLVVTGHGGAPGMLA